jgi:hypothetical protein
MIYVGPCEPGCPRSASIAPSSELMLNHSISNDLQRRYDLYDFWLERIEAAERWADHVVALVHGPKSEWPIQGLSW